MWNPNNEVRYIRERVFFVTFFIRFSSIQCDSKIFRFRKYFILVAYRRAVEGHRHLQRGVTYSYSQRKGQTCRPMQYQKITEAVPEGSVPVKVIKLRYATKNHFHFRKGNMPMWNLSELYNIWDDIRINICENIILSLVERCWKNVLQKHILPISSIWESNNENKIYQRPRFLPRPSFNTIYFTSILPH
jgi:hypothetical protein